MELIDTKFFRGVLGNPNTSIPSFPIILGYSIWAYHKKTGIPAYEIMRDGKKHAKAQLYIAKKFNLPFVIAFSDLNVIGDAFGSSLSYMKDVIPIHEIPAITSISDIDNLEVANPYRDGRMPVILKSCEIFIEKFKKAENIIGAGVEGPITAAGSICGMENLMRNMKNNPDLVHHVLEITTNTIIDFLNAQIEMGLDLVVLSDPSASCTCISPDFFKEFAFPYIRRIARNVNTVAILIHICGEALNIIKYLIKIPKILVISVDDVNLKKAKEIIGRKFVVLMGNVSTATLRYGTTQDVFSEAKSCIQQAAREGKFILSSACDIPPKTPIDNIRALINAGKKFGTFPIKF